MKLSSITLIATSMSSSRTVSLKCIFACAKVEIKRTTYLNIIQARTKNSFLKSCDITFSHSDNGLNVSDSNSHATRDCRFLTKICVEFLDFFFFNVCKLRCAVLSCVLNVISECLCWECFS